MYQVINADGSQGDSVSMDVLVAWAQAGRINSATIILDAVQGTSIAAGSIPDLMGKFAPPPPMHAVQHHVVHDSAPPPSGTLARTGMTLSIVVACFAVVGLLPCLGWMHWFTLIFGGITNILCWAALLTEGKVEAYRNKAIVGLVITFLAIFFGGIRLVLGAGCV